jgi:hypothetical protein
VICKCGEESLTPLTALTTNLGSRGQARSRKFRPSQARYSFWGTIWRCVAVSHRPCPSRYLIGESRASSSTGNPRCVSMRWTQKTRRLAKVEPCP